MYRKPEPQEHTTNAVPNTVQIVSQDLKAALSTVGNDTKSTNPSATATPNTNSPTRMSPDRPLGPSRVPVSRTVTEPEIIVVGEESSSINMKLRLIIQDETIEIQFTYNLDSDTVSSVASEMVRELGLQNDSYAEIERLIQEQGKNSNHKRMNNKFTNLLLNFNCNTKY